jgi:uncharacterized protein (DUF697 family)
MISETTALGAFGRRVNGDSLMNVDPTAADTATDVPPETREATSKTFLNRLSPSRLKGVFRRRDAEATSEDSISATISPRAAAAGKVISSSYKWAAASAAIPVPVVDLAGLAAVQTQMISKIAGIYGETLSREAASALVAVLIGTLLPGAGAGALVSAGAKLIPGVGTLVGAVGLASLGAAATAAIGRIFVRHFENGGTVSSLTPGVAKEALDRELGQQELATA